MKQYAAHIEGVLTNPTLTRNLSNGRTGYWCETTQTVTVRNPKACDGGTAKGFQFIGLRYNYGDARVAQFSKEIADIQWSSSTFEHILSDGEAATLLKSSLDSCSKLQDPCLL